MPTETPSGETTTNLVLNCSFCGRPSTEVAKLVAGPSVYICDSCVGLCAEIIENEGRLDAAGESDERPAAGVLLARIRRRAREMATQEAELRAWVDEARTSFGIDWARLATELGTTPDEARTRFSS